MWIDPILTAHHEAAHAVVAYLYGWDIEEISIKPKDLDQPEAAAGYVRFSLHPVRVTRRSELACILRRVDMCLAGIVGEELSDRPIYDRQGYIQDLRSAWFHASMHINPDQGTWDRGALNASLSRYYRADICEGPVAKLVDERLDVVRLLLSDNSIQRAFRELAALLIHHRTPDPTVVNLMLSAHGIA